MTDNTLSNLRKQRRAKFEEICQMIAVSLGHGDFATLSRRERKRVEEEAEEATDEWMETEVDHVHGPKLDTPLKKLLAEHHEIGEKILDAEDDVGLGR